MTIERTHPSGVGFCALAKTNFPVQTSSHSVQLRRIISRLRLMPARKDRQYLILASATARLFMCRRCQLESENYREIVPECSVHRFDDIRVQAVADVSSFDGGNIISMICENGLNCSGFLLSCHVTSYDFVFGIRKRK